LPPKSRKESQSALNGRFQIVAHKGASITIADYGLATRDEVWALTNHLDEWLSRQAPDTANLLFDMHRPYYEAAHVNHWKKSLGRYDAFIRKSCFINASPFIQLMLPTLRAFASLTGAPMKKNRGLFFNDKEAALNWLAEP
jgi:hypothetical protein